MPNRLKKLPQTWKPKKIRKHKVDQSHIYQARKYRKFRKYCVSIFPICVECEKRGIVKETEEIDHINPIRLGGQLYDLDNVQGLCKSCHARKSGKEAHL